MEKYFSFEQSNQRFHSFEAATYRRVPVFIEILHVLSSFMIYHQICNKSNMTGVTSGAGTV
jgi:hypothetical protein